MARLQVSAHECVQLRVNDPDPKLRALLARLPVKVRYDSWGRWALITRLPPSFLWVHISNRLGVEWRPKVSLQTGTCRCDLKAALVPAQNNALWARLMCASPFGPLAVRKKWPYLGIAVIPRRWRLHSQGAPSSTRQSRWRSGDVLHPDTPPIGHGCGCCLGTASAARPHEGGLGKGGGQDGGPGRTARRGSFLRQP
eukprot:8566335-Pyramimonas_sp.AAC.1